MKKKQFDSDIFILNDKYLRLTDILDLGPQTVTELDLGCGSGDMAHGLAALYPERVILAADVMLGRLRKVARGARRRNITNLRLLRVKRVICARLFCRINPLTEFIFFVRIPGQNTDIRETA